MEMTATDPGVEWGVQHSEGQRAAAYVLRCIAQQPGQLMKTLLDLGLLPPARGQLPASGAGSAAPASWPQHGRADGPDASASASSVALRRPGLAGVLPQPLLSSLVTDTGLPLETFEQATIEQLRRVAAFARSDGDAVADNIRAAEYLIVSGRVSMFSR